MSGDPERGRADTGNLRIARPSDASILAAISMEVWLGTYAAGRKQLFC